MTTFNRLIDATLTGGMFVIKSFAYLQGLLFALLVLGLVAALIGA